MWSVPPVIRIVRLSSIWSAPSFNRQTPSFERELVEIEGTGLRQKPFRSCDAPLHGPDHARSRQQKAGEHVPRSRDLSFESSGGLRRQLELRKLEESMVTSVRGHSGCFLKRGMIGSRFGELRPFLIR